ncbi:MAG: GyrI-like domain-containing protein [Clostridia bacterium]|nr:GyrI-like domain-containing protein [Clostridia bacterium]
MEITRIVKESFTVIGREGSTKDGEGFIQRLWKDANEHFSEIADLVKKDERGVPVGFWGAMTDFSRSFKPWDDFCRGLYLAGAECSGETEAPEGWTKWIVPGFEYLRVQCDGSDTFARMMRYLDENGIALAGAVHDFTCPETGRNYMFFPVRKL